MTANVMTANEKLVAFMWGKNALLEKFGYKTKIKKFQYFDETLAESILKWNDLDAQRIFYAIKEDITKGASGLTPTLCPFCLYFNRACYKCNYGERKGCCWYPDSVYQNIVDYMYEKTITTPKRIPKSIFSNNFYIKLLKKIDKLDKPMFNLWKIL